MKIILERPILIFRNSALIKVEMTKKEEIVLKHIFKEENKKLFKFLGKDLGWND